MGEGIVGSDYLGIVCRAADEERLARAFAAHLVPSRTTSSASTASCAATRSCPRSKAPARFARRHRAALPLPAHRAPRRLRRATSPRSRRHRPQFKRRRRWLEKRPGFALECLTAPDALVTGLDALFALHHQRWAAEGGSDAIDSPEVEAFHRLAARALAERGWARLYLLHAEGAPRAALYGFRHGDRFVFYQAGYDPEWRARSVGTVLLGEVVRQCFDEALHEYDFLRGTESYKLNWANGFRETVRLRARDASLRAAIHDAGRTAYWRLREAGKRALPESALEWARRARKRIGR